MDIILHEFFNQTIFVKILIVGVCFYMIIKGVIVFPFIPIGNKKEKTHKACLLYSSALDNNSKNKKIWEIKTRDTLYEQMNIVSSAHVSILFKMKQVYSNVATNKKDIKHYDRIISLIENKKVKSVIRKWLKENGFTSKTETEFMNYVDEKITFLLQVVIQELDDDYDDNLFNLSRATLKRNNIDHLIPYAKNVWHKMFYDCRAVSVANEAKIKKLEEELHE